MSFRSLSIRSLLALLLLAAFVPTAALALALMLTSVEREYQVSWQRSEARTTFTIAAVDVQMDALQGTLDALAANPALNAGDIAAFHGFARAITGERVDAVSLVRPDGVTVMNSRVAPGVTPPAFSVPDDTVRETLRRKKTEISDIFLGATSRRPIFAMMKPVSVAGEPHVLAVGLFASRFEPLIARTLPPWEAMIVDGAANDVVHFPPRSVLDGETRAELAARIRDVGAGRMEVKTAQGEDLLLTYERSASGEWAVITGLPRSAAESAIRQQALIYAVGAAILIVPGLVFALWLGVRLVRSADRLAHLTNALTGGEPLKAAGDAMACRELEQVSLRLQQVGCELQARETQLRQQRDLAEARSEEIRRKSEDLGRSNTDLEQFAYVASHDLREPLRMISNFLTLLERNLGTALNRRNREYLDFARDGASRLDRMVVDLLDYSRIGRHDRLEEYLGLSDMVRDAVELLRLRIEETGTVLDVADPLPSVSGQREELVRLFQNLLSNAIKYRRPDHPPRIVIRSHPLNGRGVWISVEDNGCGIDPQYHGRIFAIFQRLNDSTSCEGTGIGLSVCKKIVETHGGRIWVESRPGQGSTFHFTLRERDELTSSP